MPDIDDCAGNRPARGVTHLDLPPRDRQLLVTEPFYDTNAIVNLTAIGNARNQVFGLSSLSRIHSHALNIPVDLTPVMRNTDDVNWASSTTLDEQGGSGSPSKSMGSDFYVANQGDNTIVRMEQDGTVVKSNASQSTGIRSTMLSSTGSLR